MQLEGSLPQSQAPIWPYTEAHPASPPLHNPLPEDPS